MGEEVTFEDVKTECAEARYLDLGQYNLWEGQTDHGSLLNSVYLFRWYNLPLSAS